MILGLSAGVGLSLSTLADMLDRLPEQAAG
jgi:hypothetical protein